MAIKNLFKIFENQLNQIEEQREKSARVFAHYYGFPLDKTTQVIKSAFSAIVLKARITKNNNPFTKNSELEKAIDSCLKDAFYKVYTERNLLDEFSKRFPNGVSIAKDSSKTVPKIQFIAGTYQQKRPGNIKRDRTIVTDNLLIDAVNELLDLIPTKLDKIGSSKYKKHYASFKKQRNSAGNYDTRAVSGIGIGLHGDQDENTTVAMLAFLDGVKRASKQYKPQMGGSANTYFDEQVNKINNIFGVRKGLKVSKRTLEEYVKNPKLIDEIEVQIEYGTQLSQKEQASFDAKILKAEMEAAKNAALLGLTKFIQHVDYPALSGSKTLKERIIDGTPLTVLENTTSSLKKATVRKRLPNKGTSKKTSSSMKSKSSKPRRETKVSKTLGKKRTIHYGRKNSQAGVNNPIALKELINQQLPSRILPKMQAPALVNRTGRFRHSAEVTNIVVGPRGGTQIDYTYQRNPYEVFEPGSGSPLANQYRDPRKIIGGTVREIAQEIMGKKFITVRRV